RYYAGLLPEAKEYFPTSGDESQDAVDMAGVHRATKHRVHYADHARYREPEREAGRLDPGHIDGVLRLVATGREILFRLGKQPGVVTTDARDASQAVTVRDAGIHESHDGETAQEEHSRQYGSSERRE